MPTAPESLHDGRYRVERVLGVGGMSVVLLAHDTRMGVYRAIKLLHKRFAQSPEIRERFENEATAQAGLRHPNILMVHDVVEDEAGVYLVMELADGGSLAERVKDSGPLSPKEAARHTMAVASALQTAHTEGVIHRDIKPENMLIDHHGVLKLADFGIARLAQRNANLTRTGMVMGTWAYMPPEQRESARQVDGRADIYALGASLYFLLTGRQPSALHNAESHATTLEEIPPELAAIIVRATRLWPEDRYDDCAAMQADLQAIVDTLSDEPVVAFVPDPDRPGATQPVAMGLSDMLRRGPAIGGTSAHLLDGSGAGGSGETAVPDPLDLAAMGEDEDVYPQIAPPAVGAPAAVTHPAFDPVAPPAPSGALGRPILIGAAVALVASVGLIAILLPRLLSERMGPAGPGAPVEASPTVQAPPEQAPPEEAPTDQAPTEQAGTVALPQAPPAPETAPAAPARGSTSGTTTSSARSGSSSQPRVIEIGPLPGHSSSSAPEEAPVAPPADPTGVVVVRTVPSGATVREGGKDLVRSGPGYVLPVGSHTLEIVSPAGEKTRIPVVVRTDHSVEICYSFDTNSACGGTSP